MLTWAYKFMCSDYKLLMESAEELECLSCLLSKFYNDQEQWSPINTSSKQNYKINVYKLQIFVGRSHLQLGDG